MIETYAEPSAKFNTARDLDLERGFIIAATPTGDGTSEFLPPTNATLSLRPQGDNPHPDRASGETSSVPSGGLLPQSPPPLYVPHVSPFEQDHEHHLPSPSRRSDPARDVFDSLPTHHRALHVQQCDHEWGSPVSSPGSSDISGSIEGEYFPDFVGPEWRGYNKVHFPPATDGSGTTGYTSPANTALSLRHEDDDPPANPNRTSGETGSQQDDGPLIQPSCSPHYVDHVPSTEQNRPDQIQTQLPSGSQRPPLIANVRVHVRYRLCGGIKRLMFPRIPSHSIQHSEAVRGGAVPRFLRECG